MRSLSFHLTGCPRWSSIGNRCIRFILIFAFVLMLGNSLFSVQMPVVASASGHIGAQHTLRSIACSIQTVPDEHSLLIVLLDRSSSMGLKGSGTDPDNYSASVTNALADVWVGPIAVIIFSGDKALTINPIARTLEERMNLKDQVNASVVNGYTPMDSAFQDAQTLLSKQGFPPGSRIVLITDGNPQTVSDPSGTQHEQPDILNNLVPQFSHECITINAFGLSHNQNEQDKKDAISFLMRMTARTNGIYMDVSDTNSLAEVVISLYAQWRKLEFHSIPRDTISNDYPLTIDSSFQNARIITFHSGNFAGQNNALTTKSGQHIPSSEIVSSISNHYQIDTLLPPIPADTYFVDTGGDEQALVYVLAESIRTLQFVQPTSTTQAYGGQPLTIQVQLVDQGKGLIVPAASEQKIFIATVTETIHGKQLPSWTVNLQQNQGSSIFTGQFTISQEAKSGDKIGIKVFSKYQGIVHTTQERVIPVVIQELSPPPSVCCHISWSILISGIAIFFIAVFVFLFLRSVFIMRRGSKERLPIDRLKKHDVEAWNQWRRDNPNVRPDLTGVDLRSVDLRDVDLSKVILMRANLSRANLSGANLSRANLSGANLRGAVLTNATLENTDLRNTRLHEALLQDANLNNVIYKKTNLNGADLTRVILQDANLSGASLRRTTLAKAILINTNFRGADLTGAILPEADLSGAQLGEAILKGADLREAILKNADLSKADLSEATLQNADLSEAIVKADLSRADLSGANLSEATLKGAILKNANLRQATLLQADLSRVDLTRAKLRGANLSEATLRETDLSSADLNGADLSSVIIDDAKFYSVDLRGVTFEGAYICGAIFVNTDLSMTRGLEMVKHGGPSIVDLATEARSHGNIPSTFLRGIGASDEQINRMRQQFEEYAGYYTCFISHSIKDQVFSDTLYTDLQRKGVRCWYAPKDMTPGESLDNIDAAVRRHDKLLLILSKNSIESEWVKREVEKALEEAQNEQQEVLFPIRIDNVVQITDKPWASKVWRERHTGDFTGWEQPDTYQCALEHFLNKLKRSY